MSILTFWRPRRSQIVNGKGNADGAQAIPRESTVVNVEALPRDYNFAVDILKRNLDAGRSSKLAYIDDRRSVTYGELAERVNRFGNVLRSLGVRPEERIFA